MTENQTSQHVSPVQPSVVPRLPSKVEVFALMKVELLLWLGCVAQIGRCLLYYPLRAQGTKEILMGLKVEFSSRVIVLLGYSDFLASYKIVGIGIGVGLLFLLVYGAHVITGVAVARRQQGPTSFAWYQLTTTGVLAVVLFLGVICGNFIESVYMEPLLKLVNAVD